MVWVFPTVDGVLKSHGVSLNALEPDNLEEAIRSAIATHPPTFTLGATESTVADPSIQVLEKDHGSASAVEG
jgi:hypothetical protein